MASNFGCISLRRRKGIWCTVYDKMQDARCTMYNVPHILACAILHCVPYCLSPLQCHCTFFIIHYTLCVPTMAYCLSRPQCHVVSANDWFGAPSRLLFSIDMPGTRRQTDDEEICEKFLLETCFRCQCFHRSFMAYFVSCQTGYMIFTLWLNKTRILIIFSKYLHSLYTAYILTFLLLFNIYLLKVYILL